MVEIWDAIQPCLVPLVMAIIAAIGGYLGGKQVMKKRMGG